MPDRELAEHLRAELGETLTAGAPLVAPLPAQARYATAMTTPAPRVRRRMATAGAAAAAVVALAAFAGPPQTRAWIGQSVGSIAHSVRHPGEDDNNPAPTQGSSFGESPAASPTEHQVTVPSSSPQPRVSPEPSESPEPSGSPEPRESPEPGDSPRPSPSPGGPTPSPRPSPSDE